MAAVMQKTCSNAFSWTKIIVFLIICIFIQISMKFVPTGVIDNKSALV